MGIDNVADITPRLQYIASAAQTAFDYNFSIFTSADLVVVVDGVTKALDTDYTVDRAEEEDTDTETHGGTVTFLTPMTGGEIVTIYRDIVIERDTDIQQNGPWSSTAYNDEQDKTYLIMQQIQANVDRALRIPVIAEVDSADIVLEPANYADKYLAFDTDGKPTPALLSSTTMTQASIGALFYPRTAAEIAAGVTPTSYVIPSFGVYPERYGAVGDGVTDDSAAIRTACSVLGNYGCLKFTPGKKYRWECTQPDPYTGTGAQNGYAFNGKTGIVIDARGATFVQSTVNNSTFGLINFYACTNCEVWGGHVEGSYTVDTTWTGGYVAFQGQCRGCKLIDGSIEGGYALAVVINRTSTVSGVTSDEPVDCMVSGYANNTRRSLMMLGAGAGHRCDIQCGNVARFYVESCRGMHGRLSIRDTDVAYVNEKVVFTGSNAGVTQNINLLLDCEIPAANFVRFQCQDASAIAFKNIKIHGRVYGVPSSAAVTLGAGSGSAGVTYDNIDLEDLYVEVTGGAVRAVYVLPSHAIAMTNIKLPRVVRSAGTGNNTVQVDNTAGATINGLTIPDGFRYTSTAGGAYETIKIAGGTVQNLRVGNGDVVSSTSATIAVTIGTADGFICGAIKLHNSKTVDFSGSKNLKPGILLDQGGNGFMYSGAIADATNYSGFETILVTSGSPTINSLKYIVPGQRVTFIFNGGTPTFANGANMKLAGAVNFVATALDTLTLICIDPPGGGPLATSTMYEVSRSVN